MQYKKITKGIFLERPNRFVAVVELAGKKEICHVKNTGRCKELLQKGVTVVLEDCVENTKRKTRYDVIGVYKGERLINIDSQAPNKVVGEYMEQLFPDLCSCRPETKYGNSRFDFYVETKAKKMFLEVKGVTLEENGIVRFPDAPTERGIKHIRELEQCLTEGYEAYVIFVVQMEHAVRFEPNWETHAAFGEALLHARQAGVQLLCFNCTVKEDCLQIAAPVPLHLEHA